MDTMHPSGDHMDHWPRESLSYRLLIYNLHPAVCELMEASALHAFFLMTLLPVADSEHQSIVISGLPASSPHPLFFLFLISGEHERL